MDCADGRGAAGGRGPPVADRPGVLGKRRPARLPRMKIYTRTGDDGTTGLLGPGRVPKHAPRVEAYGAVDELNACLGVARALDHERWASEALAGVQADLFALGAELAAPDPAAIAGTRLADERVSALERWIDAMEAELPPLGNFILPGGSPLGAELHRARTVCRRAERRVTALAVSEPVAGTTVRYLNRLADLLFVLARWCNQRAGVAETMWRPRG